MASVNQEIIHALPECLERVDGDIRVTGHRVSLFQILDAIFDGVSIEGLGERFPSISPGKLREVVAFCRQQLEVMRRYHEEQRATFAAMTGDRVTEGPSLEELRRRKREKELFKQGM